MVKKLKSQKNIFDTIKSSIFLLFIGLFASLSVFTSCENVLNDSLVISNENIGSGNIQNRNFRIRMNDNYSVAVSAQLYSGNLTNIEYDVVEQNPDDKYAVLDFSIEEHVPSHLLIINKDYSNEEDEIVSARTGIVPEYTFSCDCKSLDTDTVGDCIERKYLIEYYCDGNWCQACSLKVHFITGGNNNSIENNSVIVLPNANF